MTPEYEKTPLERYAGRFAKPFTLSTGQREGEYGPRFATLDEARDNAHAALNMGETGGQPVRITQLVEIVETVTETVDAEHSGVDGDTKESPA